MCSPATCRKCGRTTWSGCGQHVKQVMAGVPAKDRCSCDTAIKPGRVAKPAKGSRVLEEPRRGLLAALFRR